MKLANNPGNNPANILPKRALRSLVGACLSSLLLMLAPALAQAEVKLTNTIQKIQTWVDAAGTVQRRLVPADKVVPGDELQYTVRFSNEGVQAVDAGTIVITDAIPEHTQYIDGSARGIGSEVRFSLDGQYFAQGVDLTHDVDGQQVAADAKDYAAIRWHFSPSLAPGESGQVSFKVRLL